MALYFPFQNVKAVQQGPLSYPNQIVAPTSANNPTSPAGSHSFVLVVKGVGTCSATVQIVGSNDGVSFVPYGAPVTASGPATDLTPATQQANGGTPYNYIGGYVTAISGTQAAATLELSA